MSSKPKRKRNKDDEDWIYDPVVVKGVLRAKKEVEEAIKNDIHLPTLEELIEKFEKEDAKKIQD